MLPSNSNNILNTEDTESQEIHSYHHRSYILYLIRHGEALHNVQEKLAEEAAQEEGKKLNLSPLEIKQRMELARHQVLEDPAFFDSPLTERGVQQAREASTKLYAMQRPLPTEVFVSPLQRTLQTAAHLFVPEHHTSIRVREELRERLTGRPADNRYSSSLLASRKSFARFSFMNLRRHSMIMDDHDQYDDVNAALPTVEDMGNVDLDVTMDDDEPRQRIGQDDGDFGLGVDLESSAGRGARTDWHLRSMSSNISSISSSRNVECCTELEADMKVRAAKLLEILCASESSSVAVVSHKAYLRALERGVFGLESAPEFGNCEIRLYNVSIDARSKSLIGVERVV